MYRGSCGNPCFTQRKSGFGSVKGSVMHTQKPRWLGLGGIKVTRVVSATFNKLVSRVYSRRRDYSVRGHGHGSEEEQDQNEAEEGCVTLRGVQEAQEGRDESEEEVRP